ncbi:hypothetical protein GCM10010232_38170 [Streptomyces amakusaensis]|uniref:Terminal protein Tpg-like protein n=1 Tax=Streptomyces amakusaensis TaxID=67271 RepID=A0ABW0ATT9_9ACTN
MCARIKGTAWDSYLAADTTWQVCAAHGRWLDNRRNPEAGAIPLDDLRVRWITQDLPGEVARELFAAQDEKQQLVILARALGHAYFRDGGQRGRGLHIAFTDVEFADFSIG